MRVGFKLSAPADKSDALKLRTDFWFQTSTMGNSVSGSKERHIDDTVDFGSLTPQGVYTGPQDWNQQVVGHLIVDRKLAPFYKPLEEYEESWDDEHILAARKGNTNPAPPLPEPPTSASSTSSKFHHHKTPNKTGKEPFRPTEASVYRGAIECPICFLVCLFRLLRPSVG